jgi:hypothetical protein
MQTHRTADDFALVKLAAVHAVFVSFEPAPARLALLPPLVEQPMIAEQLWPVEVVGSEATILSGCRGRLLCRSRRYLVLVLE